MYAFLVGYVVLSTAVPVLVHHQLHGVTSTVHVLLSFFLGLNAIVCLWEQCLLFAIDRIESQYAKYKETFKGRSMDVALQVHTITAGHPHPTTTHRSPPALPHHPICQFFTLPVTSANILDKNLWAEVR